jgi:hypothetical protein
MQTTKMLICLAGLAAGLGGASLGRAADNCSGQWVQIATAIVTLDDNRSVPSHMAVGVCDPSTLRCTYKDKDGDSWTNDVSIAGTWKTVEGTGKYANSKSSGWSKTMRMDVGPEGGVYVGVWGGQCSR